MAYPCGAVERAMKVQEVILRALDGKLTWPQAADILGRSPRSIRRLRWRLEHIGYDGLFDRRRRRPSPKRAPIVEIQRVLANAEFGRPPADPVSAFVPLGRVDLDQILCIEAERVVGRDNVVTAERVPLQLAKQPGRRTCAGLRVLIRHHLNGHHTVWYGGRCLGRYDRAGQPLRAA
jgi:hypothetical protein